MSDECTCHLLGPNSYSVCTKCAAEVTIKIDTRPMLRRLAYLVMPKNESVMDRASSYHDSGISGSGHHSMIFWEEQEALYWRNGWVPDGTVVPVIIEQHLGD